MRVYIKVNRANGTTEYRRAELTRAQALRLDNGAMISCGLKVPDDLSEKQLARLRTTVVTEDQWKHSSCLSRCTQRGDDKCTW